MNGGPGTFDPQRIDYRLSLRQLLTAAYRVGNLQLSAPTWLDDRRFDITAKLPSGITRAQLRQLLQQLLADRFRLAFHWEQRALSAFTLTIDKNGQKLKESVDQTPVSADDFDPLPPGPPNELELDREGYPIVPPDEGSWVVALRNGRARTHQIGASMHDLAVLLSNQLSRPVEDATGLNGRYEFTLSWTTDTASPDAEPGPGLQDAIRQQLGLKLEASKRPVDVMVIEHIEKDPTEN
jgi:uncharacterized protein (TIGR03435 family)